MNRKSNLFRNYFEFSARTSILVPSFIGVVILVLLVFPALPLHGAEMIDVKLHYSLADVHAAMLRYGAEGRRAYALASPTLDTLFPAFYVTFFSGLIYRFRPKEGLWFWAYVPVIAGAWDLCENAQITAMLLQYPDISAKQVALASFFTTVKHLLSAVYEISAVLFLIIHFLSRVKSPHPAKTTTP